MKAFSALFALRVETLTAEERAFRQGFIVGCWTATAIVILIHLLR